MHDAANARHSSLSDRHAGVINSAIGNTTNANTATTNSPADGVTTDNMDNDNNNKNNKNNKQPQ